MTTQSELRETTLTADRPISSAVPLPTVKSVLSTGRGTLLLHIGGWLLVLAIGLAMPYVLSLYPLQLAVQGATLGLLALSVGWLLRQTGLLSFGHAAFYGAAGYAAGLFVNRLDMGTAPALLLGVAVGTGLSLVCALLIVRTPGIAFSMLTLAIGMLVWVFATQTRSLTNGFDGLPVRFTSPLLGQDPSSYTDPVTAWPLIWLTLMAVAALLWGISRTVFGRRLIAIRENEERVRFIGHTTYLPRVIAFTISGLVASVAGSFAVLNLGFLSTDSLYWSASGLALIVAVIGGSRSVLGPPAGALAFIALQAQLSGSTHYQVIIGSVLMLVVILAPGGASELAIRVGSRISNTLKRGVPHA